MRLLFLTISDQQHHPLHRYTDLHCSYDFRTWEAGFNTVCADVHIFDYYESFVADGPVVMEDHIRELVRKHHIQLLIVPNMYFELAPTFLRELRSYGCKSLVAFFDDSMRFENTNRFYLSSFDFYLTHESEESSILYKPYGIDTEFFPVLPSYSYYENIIRNIDTANIETIHDVVFVGAKIADRNVFIDYLMANGIDIGVYGRGWEAGMLSTEKMLAAFHASKISLNFVKTIDGSGRAQFKARLFEIIMAGGFVLSEHSDELTDYFDIGLDIDTFRSPEKLLEKIKFYLANDNLRKEMAARAIDKVRKHYSFESSWRKYLTDMENGTIKKCDPHPGYLIPVQAVNTFLDWNLSFIYGRFMLGQYGLAYQHYKFLRRELEGISSYVSTHQWLMKMAFQKFIITIARRIFSQRQISSMRDKYSKCMNVGAKRAVRRRVLPRVHEISESWMADKASLLKNVSHKIVDFLNQRKVPGKDFEYLYSENANRPTLYASAYACMTLSLLGRLSALPSDNKLHWIEYFDSYQNEADGLFYDPVVDSALFRTADWWGTRHLSLHMISAYTDLGGKPRYPFRFLEEYYDHDRIKKWLDGFNWSDSVMDIDDIDNKIMNIGCLLQYQRDTWKDAQAGSAVAYIQNYLIDKINPETGMWGSCNVHDPNQRSRMVQFAYHLFPLFFYDNITIKNPDKIVQIVLATQNELGGFGVKLNSSACEDIDSIDILIRLSPFVPARKAEIDTAQRKAFIWVLCNQVDDGGFVFRWNEAITYGHEEMSSRMNRGGMFPTWFRTLSLAYLARHFSLDNFQITPAPGLEN